MTDATKIWIDSKDDPIIDAILTAVKVGSVKWSYGDQDKDLDSSVTIHLSDKTEISFAYSTFMQRDDWTGWINHTHAFVFKWRGFMGFKFTGFPKMKEYIEELKHRKNCHEYAIDKRVESALKLFVQEYTRKA